MFCNITVIFLETHSVQFSSLVDQAWLWWGPKKRQELCINFSHMNPFNIWCNTQNHTAAASDSVLWFWVHLWRITALWMLQSLSESSDTPRANPHILEVGTKCFAFLLEKWLTRFIDPQNSYRFRFSAIKMSLGRVWLIINALTSAEVSQSGWKRVSQYFGNKRFLNQKSHILCFESK